jgi:hypothetical protein
MTAAARRARRHFFHGIIAADGFDVVFLVAVLFVAMMIAMLIVVMSVIVMTVIVMTVIMAMIVFGCLGLADG